MQLKTPLARSFEPFDITFTIESEDEAAKFMLLFNHKHISRFLCASPVVCDNIRRLLRARSNSADTRFDELLEELTELINEGK